MKVSTDKVSFTINVDFDVSDVDMVYKEMMSRGVQTPVPSILTNGAKIKIDKKKLHKTPTEGTVDFCLNWLAGYVDRNEMCTQSSKWDRDYSKPLITITRKDGFKYKGAVPVKTELEEIGITVTEWNGLMMGTCSLVCEIDSEKYSKKLVEKAHKIVNDVFKKYVRYHKQKKAA